MARKKHTLLPVFTTKATAIASVALVLFILGVATLIGTATHRLSDTLKQNMGFVIMLRGDVLASDIELVKEKALATPGVAKVEYASADNVLARWQEIVGEDEDIVSLAGVNPFNAELNVKVTPEYAKRDSIAAMISSLSLLPQVEEASMHTEMVDNVSATLRSVTVGLLFVGVALLIVSFVLIFNTVRLSVYARRFLINTMRLVGATPAFIRRPFLKDNVVNGLLAGVFGAIALAGFTFWVHRADSALEAVAPWGVTVAVMGGMLAVGVIVCLLAALVATNRYLSLTYDELFR